MSYIWSTLYYRNHIAISHSEIVDSYYPVFFTVPNGGYKEYNWSLTNLFLWCKKNIQGNIAYPCNDGLDEYCRKQAPYCVYFEKRNDALMAKLKMSA